MSKQAFIIFASILGICILVCGLGFLVLRNGMEEDYSGFQFSQSIEDAKWRKVLVSTPEVENSEKVSSQYRYHLKEAWIEEIRQVKYKFLFYRTEQVEGYQLLTTFDVPYPTAERDNLRSCQPLVNGKIKLDGWSADSKTEIFMGRISPPFPEKITLTFDCTR